MVVVRVRLTCYGLGGSYTLRRWRDGSAAGAAAQEARPRCCIQVRITLTV